MLLCSIAPGDIDFDLGLLGYKVSQGSLANFGRRTYERSGSGYTSNCDTRIGALTSEREGGGADDVCERMRMKRRENFVFGSGFGPKVWNSLFEVQGFKRKNGSFPTLEYSGSQPEHPNSKLILWPKNNGIADKNEHSESQPITQLPRPKSIEQIRTRAHQAMHQIRISHSIPHP